MSELLDLTIATVAKPATHALIHFLWQGSLVALALGVLLLLLRNRSADLRYRCTCWALLVMVLLPIGTAVRYAHLNSGIDAKATTDMHSGPAQNAPGASNVAGDPDSWNTATTIKKLAKSPETTTTSRIAGELLRQLAWDPGQTGTTRWILGLWLCGIVLLSASHLGGWFQVRQLRSTQVEAPPEAWQESADRLCRRLGIDRTVRVLCSTATEVPMVIGWLRPVVLIPVGALVGLPIQQYECILAHELAHIWRRDYLVNLLQVVAETLLFYHPAVWWVSRQIRTERENCCDDIAVELSGSKLAYARALVDIEELRHAAPRLALGAGDGSLVNRVKRLVGGPDMSTNSSRTLLAGTLAALGILICGTVLALAAQNQFGEAMYLAANASNEQNTTTGSWSAERDGDDLYFEIRERGKRSGRHQGRFNMTLHVEPGDFTNLSYTEDVTFSLLREAGDFVFKGDFEGPEKSAEGDGRFTFTPDANYMARLAELGTDDLDDDAMIVLAAQDLRTKTVDKLRDKGYGPFDSDELVTIAIFDVTPDYIDDMGKLGYKNIDLDDLVAMKVHGISRDYIEELRDAGVESDTLDDLMAWKIHGVTAAYMADLRKEFGQDMTNDDIMAFRIHGVDGEFAKSLESVGFGDLDADELLAWKIHGISADYVKEIRKEFGQDMDADDIMSFRIHGVSGDFARSFTRVGLTDLDADDLLSFKIHGISASYIEDMRQEFGQDMDIDDIRSFRIHGVTSGYAGEIEKLGYDLDADDLLSWKIHGVNATFINGLADLGYKDIDAGDLISMKIHGAGPSWVKRLHDRGLDDLDVDDLIRLRISGVDF